MLLNFKFPLYVQRFSTNNAVSSIFCRNFAQKNKLSKIFFYKGYGIIKKTAKAGSEKSVIFAVEQRVDIFVKVIGNFA